MLVDTDLCETIMQEKNQVDINNLRVTGYKADYDGHTSLKNKPINRSKDNE